MHLKIPPNTALYLLNASKALSYGLTIQFSSNYSHYQLKRIAHKLFRRFTQPHSTEFSPWQFTIYSPSDYLSDAHHIFIIPSTTSKPTPSPTTSPHLITATRIHRKNKIKQLKKSLSSANAEINNLKKQLHSTISIIHSLKH